MELEWKPSELPENALIQARVEAGEFYKRFFTSRFIKDEDGGWEEVGGYDPEFFDSEEADKVFKEVKILALPPSWYDDWRIFDRNLPQYRINRRGEVRRSASIAAGRVPSSITESMVRRAFKNNPI